MQRAPLAWGNTVKSSLMHACVASIAKCHSEQDILHHQSANVHHIQLCRQELKLKHSKLGVQVNLQAGLRDWHTE